MSNVAVIGAGFSGLSAAAYLSASGHNVTVYEKNGTAGGRARQFKTGEGYVFDMGPSWYWMPDLFERFFNDFGRTRSEFYDLKLLDPSFDMVFDDRQVMQVPADFEALCELFECIEKGSSIKLRAFLKQAEFKYKKGMKEMAYMPGLSMGELLKPGLIRDAMRLDIFSAFSDHVRDYFSHPKLIDLMEFPVLFLGGMPSDMPALYSLMNYAGLKLKTWYPEGGFGKVAEGVMAVAAGNGTDFQFNTCVEKIIAGENSIRGLIANGEKMECDAVIAAADYHHVENELLSEEHRNYQETYWQKKTFAPSCLIFYLGISRKIESLSHHTLFFEEDLLTHSKEIYTNPGWPSAPLFYACCPTRTDRGLAPGGHETLFLLMPVAPGLEDNRTIREKYFQIMMRRLEKQAGIPILRHINYKKSYGVSDFIREYHAYKGNAYGLANTLMQTAVLKPKIKNRKISRLFYAGQLTVPGPGVPPALISGKIAAEQLMKELEKEVR